MSDSDNQGEGENQHHKTIVKDNVDLKKDEWKNRVDVLASLIIYIGAICTWSYSVFVVCPEVFKDGNSLLYFFTFIIGTWSLIAVYLNLVLVRLRTASIKNKFLVEPTIIEKEDENLQEESSVRFRTLGQQFTREPFKSTEAWHICSICETYVPPRTWHCKQCATCIFRREHHCIFTMCCIGKDNHSNFLGLLFYLCVGTTMATILIYFYENQVNEVSLWAFVLKALITYYVLFNFTFGQVLASLNLIGALIAWAVFGIYLSLAFKGQTSADKTRKITRLPPGRRVLCLKNLTEFLGENPIWRILNPFHAVLLNTYERQRQSQKNI